MYFVVLIRNADVMSFPKAWGMFEQGLFDNDDVFESINNKQKSWCPQAGC